MLYWLKQKLKKNYFIYFISLFLYQKVFRFCYSRLANYIKSLINYKKNKIFKSHIKEEEKIILYNKEFFYPKYSIFYEEFFKNFEAKTTLNTEYNLIAKEFFEKEIECILDVGANIGYNSLFYNKFFSDKIKIHCFEPHPVSYYFLKKNLSLFNNIKLYNFALGSEKKEDYMSIPDHESHRLSNLGTMSIGQNSNNLKAKILIKKFDSLTISLEQFKSIYIKIDVEGYEDNVLKGMLNFLHNDINLYLKIEINKDFHNVAKISSIINFIEKLNYKFFTIKNGKFINYNKSQIIKFLIYGNEHLFCKN
jgi:FkbM family methyltransferase